MIVQYWLVKPFLKGKANSIEGCDGTYRGVLLFTRSSLDELMEVTKSLHDGDGKYIKVERCKQCDKARLPFEAIDNNGIDVTGFEYCECNMEDYDFKKITFPSGVVGIPDITLTEMIYPKTVL